MAVLFFDRVKVGVVSAPGTGAAALGAAVTGFRTFAAAGVPDQGLVSYVIEDGASWEIGHGVYTASGASLARSTVIASSNNGAAINASATAAVYLTLLAEDIASLAPWDFVPAKLAQFPTVAGDTGDLGLLLQTADDPNVGLLFSVTTPNPGNNWIGVSKSIVTPGAAWHAIYKLNATYSGQNYSTVGALITKSGGTNALIYGYPTGQGVCLVQFNTNGKGSNGTVDLVQGLLWKWFRVDFDGSDTLTFSVSADGKLWSNFTGKTYSAQSLIGGKPDTFGFAAAPNNSQLQGGSVPYYADTMT